MTRLYEISEEYRSFIAAVEAGDIPEDAIADTLEGIEAAFEVKADNIACLIKELLMDSQGIKSEADNLAARAKAKNAHADRLTRYLEAQMRLMGGKPIETARNRLSIRKTPAACILDDEAGLTAYLLEYGMTDCVKQETSIRKTELAKRLKAGEEIPGAHMRAGERLDIK